MASLPSIRILMATYNGAAHLPDQLATIAAQRDADWALWVSDDGSTDGTRDQVTAFSKAHPDRDVRLLDGPRVGSAAANFLSLLHHPDLPPGPVAFADQDDLWVPDRLATGWATLPGPDGLSSAPYLIWDGQGARDAVLAARGTLPRSAKPRYVPRFQDTLLSNEVPGNVLLLGADLVAALRRAGPPVPTPPFHDWWVTVFAAATGAPMAMAPEPLVLYRQHGGNVIGARAGLAARMHRLAMLMDGRWGAMAARNLAALEALDVPLHTEAARILAARRTALSVRAWLEAEGAFDRLDHAPLIRLAARLGRLDALAP